jgi:hypothetical protein
MQGADFLDDTSETTDHETKSGDGFFGWLLSLLSPENDPEREKKKLLKDIAKQLKRHRYKFYKPGSEEVLPPMAEFFHEIYRVVGPAQVFLERAEGSSAIRAIIIEYYLSDEQRQMLDMFSAENIRALAEKMDTKQLAAQLKDKLVAFYSAFDNDKVRQIEDTFGLFQLFLEIVHFDYYFLLKKFDSGLPERDLMYKPKFEQINGDYIVDDLKDFLSILPQIQADAPWKNLFEILKAYKAEGVVSVPAWKKALRSVVDVRKSYVLRLIVQHISKDPYYREQSFPGSDRIVDDYLSKIKTQTELTIQKILKERRGKKIDQITQFVFGTTAVSRMKFYTEKTNMTFAKKMMGGFIHVEPLNYLKAFLLDYFKRDIKDLVDILLIRGRWTTNLMSQQLSDSFHALMELSERLVKFDDSLAEEGERGIALKAALSKSDRDKNAQIILRKILKDINDEAYTILQQSAQNLVSMGKNLKTVLEDYGKKPHQVLNNWSELEAVSDQNLEEQITAVYKKTYYFIQLLQFFVQRK